MKMEAHKSSRIRDLTKCLCNIFGCRALVCRPVLSSYPNSDVHAVGGQGMAFTSLSAAPSHLTLLVTANPPLRRYRWPRAPLPLLSSSWWQKWHRRCVPDYWMWGQSCIFPSLALASSTNYKDLIIPALHKQGPHPEHIVTTGCLEEERWE